MPNPPRGPRAKIERAKKHLNDLVGTISAFHKSNSYTIVHEVDPEGGWFARIEPWPPPLPPHLPLIFGDLIHNLRSALDIMICDLVRDHYPQHLGDWSGFPVVGNAKNLKAQVAQKVKGASNAVQQAVIRQKPYKRGNEPLWQLHRLNILDKHRLILTTITSNESVNFGPRMLRDAREYAAEHGVELDDDFLGLSDLWIGTGNPCDNKSGVVFRDRTTSEPDYDLQFRIHVSLHEPGLVECEPIIPFATQLIQYVEATISGFDAYFK